VFSAVLSAFGSSKKDAAIISPAPGSDAVVSPSGLTGGVAVHAVPDTSVPTVAVGPGKTVTPHAAPESADAPVSGPHAVAPVNAAPNDGQPIPAPARTSDVTPLQDILRATSVEEASSPVAPDCNISQVTPLPIKRALPPTPPPKSAKPATASGRFPTPTPAPTPAPAPAAGTVPAQPAAAASPVPAAVPAQAAEPTPLTVASGTVPTPEITNSSGAGGTAPDRAADPTRPAVTPGADSAQTVADSHTALMTGCDSAISQFAQAVSLKPAIQQRDELQRELAAIKASKADFRASVRVGKALQAAREAVAQQPLSEEDYQAFPTRHAALVQKVTAACEELLEREEFNALDALAAKLEDLKALNVSALLRTGSGDPMPPIAHPAPALPTAKEQEWAKYVPAKAHNNAISVSAEYAEDEGANDPVYVAPAALHSAIEVLSACTAISVTAEGGEDDGADDPVYVPPDAAEATFA
jgi:hypothetical protein